jgi:hypothetical protein
MLGTVEKQPAEILDYDVDFARWLDDTDTITDATVVISPTGSLAMSALDVDPALVKVWLTGGTSGVSYKVEVTVDTNAGRRGQVEFRVRVKEK